MHSAPVSNRGTLRAVKTAKAGAVFATAIGVAMTFAACGGGDDGAPGGGGSGASGGAGGTAAGDGGGAAGQAGADGGPKLADVCVKSVPLAAWPGDASCPAPKPASADSFDAALTKAGVDRCTYGFSDTTMSIWKPVFADDKYQLPIFRPLHLGLLRLPGYAKQTEDTLGAALDGDHAVSESILAAAVRQGASIDACAVLDAYGAALLDPAPLAAAIATLIGDNGGTADVAAVSSQIQGVPIDLQQALVPVLASIDWAASEFRAALGTDVSDDIDWLEATHGFVIQPIFAFPVDAAHLALLEKVDAGRMAAAAALVARAVEDAKLSAFAGKSVPAVAIDTPIGAIVLGGASGDSYDSSHLAGRSAFLLDVGGDDVYHVPTGAGRRDVPISVCVDLGGKDVYGYDEVASPQDASTRPPSDSAGRSANIYTAGQTLSRVGRQGSGVLGIGLSWDLGGGDDEYHSLALSQGAGAMGVGALFDDGGSDLYVAESTSQGSGTFGIGLLLDRDGTDSYETFFASQGFGFTRGVGMLADGGGNDSYFADPGDPAVGGDPLYASAQLPGQGNTSMCQGAGYGRRDDATGFDMGGGHGVLYDRAGDDHYTASVFAQGSGYWLGFGLLDDLAGNDTYEGLWYVQGAAAHFALGFHYEHAGNDVYNQGFPIRATSIGVGHDFSGALHFDLGGDDSYVAPGLSLGCGNSQGIGGFINVGGVDQYQPAGGNTYGCASMGHDPPFDTVRDVRPTIGIFVDSDQSDSYALPGGAPAADNGASWSLAVYAASPGAPQSEMSGGVDDDSGSVALP
jgi:hypothetical protein